MERKRLGMLVIAILLAGIALAAMPVEAKTYNPFMGHSAVQYENKTLANDISRKVRGLSEEQFEREAIQEVIKNERR